MFKYKIVFMALLLNAYQVNAITFTGNTAGLFGNDTALLQWGLGFDGPSSLLYEGVGEFSADVGVPFKVATLTYNNTEITPESDFSKTFSDMTLHSTVITESGASILDAGLTIIETDNNSNIPSDTISLLFSDEDASFFSFNGEDFTFKLLGFENSSGDFDKFFIQPENSNSPIGLYAEITAVPVPSAIWLFLTAFTELLTLNSRRTGV